MFFGAEIEGKDGNEEKKEYRKIQTLQKSQKKLLPSQ